MNKPLDIYVLLTHLQSPTKRITYEQSAKHGDTSLEKMYTVGTVPDCNTIVCVYPVLCTKCFANLLYDSTPMIYDIAYIVAQYCVDEQITVYARTYNLLKFEHGLGGLAYSA